MADGNRQTEFNIPRKAIVSALRPGEIVVDIFAGGGGASEALEQALGRPVDIAINHDEWAVGMHAANHPFTAHHREDVWVADPRAEAAGRPVGWFHASPDCTHFSQARGGQPRSRKTRALSWVVVKWAGALVKARNGIRIISLENVEQILKWGPLVAKRDKATGRVLKMDGTIAARGERVPVEFQQLVPDKTQQGRTWQQFVAMLRRMGYAVEWKVLVASDYGAGTSRKRLFMIARLDGEPIVWPAPTHGKARGLLPLVTAADSIDFSIPCPSIFTRKKPLADATMRRVARGLKRYVLDAAEPFIVGVGGRMGQSPERGASEPLQTLTAKADSSVCVPTLVQCSNASANGVADAARPLGTVTAWPRGGSHALASAHMVKFRGDSDGRAVDEPMPTITSGAGAARPAGAAHAMGIAVAHLTAMAQNVPALDPQEPLPTILAGATRYAAVTTFLEQANGGFYDGDGRSAEDPLSTITSSGTQQRLVAANMVTMRGTNTGAAADAPVRTLSAGGEHHAIVECTLSPEHEQGALRVAAFLIKYYGTALGVNIDEPLDTITTKDRLALVTVWLHGHPYVVVDIGLRMLRREELFRAQGFPPNYIIDRTADGRSLSISQSVRMVGNSVSPPPLAALARANMDHAEEPMRKAA